MTAPKKDPLLAQAEETLDLLKRIARENAENKNDRGERVAFLSWGTQVRLEEEIEALEERVDSWGQP